MRQIPIALLALSVGACVPVVPPPSHFGSPMVSVARPTPAVEASVTPLLIPGVSVAGSRPLGGSGAIDVRTQLSFTSASVAPGVWGWLPLGPEDQTRLGGRVGLIGGAGDITGEFPFQLAFFGTSAHVQLAHRLNHNPNPPLIGFTLGFEYTDLLPGLEPSRLQGSDIEYLPGLWGSLAFRAEMPLVDKTAILFGAGANAYAMIVPVPFVDLGVRF